MRVSLGRFADIVGVIQTDRRCVLALAHPTEDVVYVGNRYEAGRGEVVIHHDSCISALALKSEIRNIPESPIIYSAHTTRFNIPQTPFRPPL